MSDDILEDFMKDWDEVKYQVPLGILKKEIDPKYPYIGVDVALFFYWSAIRELLFEAVSKSVELYRSEITFLNHKALIDLMKKTIGIELSSDYYNERGRDFVVDYMSQTSEWKYSFWKDFREFYPDSKTFSEFPQTDEEYNKLMAYFDKRFEEYTLEKVKVVNINNELINNKEVLAE